VQQQPKKNTRWWLEVVHAMRERHPHGFFGFPLMVVACCGYGAALVLHGTDLHNAKQCAIVAILAACAWACLFVITHGAINNSTRYARRAEDALMFIGGVFLVILFSLLRR